MIEDATLTRFSVAPLSPERVLWAEDGEVAYQLDSHGEGICKNRQEEAAKLAEIQPTDRTLGFELDCEADFAPFELSTFLADKSINATYYYGDHQPGGEKYQETCRFKPGEKVLCIIHEGFDVVIPAIVVGPISEEYLRKMWDPEAEWSIGYDSVNDFIERWSDWNWDCVIVRPLVRITNKYFDDEPMGETFLAHRTYIFPYKKFEL